MAEKDALNRATALIRKGLSTNLDAEALTFLRKGCEMLEGLGLLEVAAPPPGPPPRPPTTGARVYYSDIFGNRVSEEDLRRETSTTTSNGNWSFNVRNYP